MEDRCFLGNDTQYQDLEKTNKISKQESITRNSLPYLLQTKLAGGEDTQILELRLTLPGACRNPDEEKSSQLKAEHEKKQIAVIFMYIIRITAIFTININDLFQENRRKSGIAAGVSKLMSIERGQALIKQ